MVVRLKRSRTLHSFIAVTSALLVAHIPAKESARNPLLDSQGFTSELVQKLVDKTFGEFFEALRPLPFRRDLVETTLGNPVQDNPFITQGRKRPGDETFGIGKRIKFFQHDFLSSALAPGMRGALITTRKNQERLAIAEAYRLFERFLEEQENHSHEADNATRRFSFSQAAVPGSAFIFIDDESIDPVKLVHRIMEDTVIHRRNFLPSVKRIVPIQATCAASSMENLTSAAAKLVQSELLGYEGTYAVEWKKSLNDNVHKMEVVDAVAKHVRAVAPNATVNLTHAQTAIHMRIIANTGCLSVLPRWHEFKQYDLVQLLNATLQQAIAEVKSA